MAELTADGRHPQVAELKRGDEFAIGGRRDDGSFTDVRLYRVDDVTSARIHAKALNGGDRLEIDAFTGEEVSPRRDREVCYTGPTDRASLGVTLAIAEELPREAQLRAEAVEQRINNGYAARADSQKAYPVYVPGKSVNAEERPRKVAAQLAQSMSADELRNLREELEVPARRYEVAGIDVDDYIEEMREALSDNGFDPDDADVRRTVEGTIARIGGDNEAGGTVPDAVRDQAFEAVLTDLEREHDRAPALA